MKKVLLMLFALVLFLPFIGAQEKASAYEGGLIAPNLFTDSLNQPVEQLTDNNETTYTVIGSGGQGVWYSFSSPKTIKSYKVKANWDFSIKFYDKNNVLLYTEQFLWQGSQTTKHNNLGQIVTNVSKIEFVTSLNMRIWEFDVFDTVTPGTVVSADAPAGLTATSGDTTAYLTWYASTGATNYNIKRSTTAGGPYTTIATAVTGNVFHDTGLTNGTKYYYVVSAVNAGGESGNSNEVSATPVSSGGGSGGSRAIVTIHLVGGTEKEYDLSAAELENFLSWTDSATQSSRYKFVKNWNIPPFKARAEYIVYGKIVNFDVDEFDPV
ncbi:fibronectin type III domain-containing protein [Cohnella hashimotonis]|uniref:Fibronectin type III domain-containing protein n=1 Tax=Cohnella hashimotonis TaxID=2826895 RepID=A0ABT6TKK9_9BACL|nr:fibronectin type III domain-containing protein [Cohnella hashimotonis]MDI4647388.1 fibronectin type III domain-containing protein [Cohnella hashimotonis]